MWFTFTFCCGCFKMRFCIEEIWGRGKFPNYTMLSFSISILNTQGKLEKIARFSLLSAKQRESCNVNLFQIELVFDASNK